MAEIQCVLQGECSTPSWKGGSGSLYCSTLCVRVGTTLTSVLLVILGPGDVVVGEAHGNPQRRNVPPWGVGSQRTRFKRWWRGPWEPLGREGSMEGAVLVGRGSIGANSLESAVSPREGGRGVCMCV